MHDCGEDFQNTSSSNYIHVKSEFEGYNCHSFVEHPETMATDRKLFPFLLDDDNHKFQCTFAPRVAYNIDKFSNAGELLDYKLVSCGDENCKESHVELIFKKEKVEGEDSGRKKQKEMKQKFNCHLCDSSFKENFHLEAHIDIFHGKTAESPLLPLVSTNSKENIENGVSLNKGNFQERNENIYLCYVCNKKFSKKISLKLHVKLFHESPDFSSQVMCLFCQKPFDHQPLLDKHILSQHPSWRPFSCPVCGEKFAILKTLQHHLPKHDGFISNNKIQNNETPENVVRLIYTDCPMPTGHPVDENRDPQFNPNGYKGQNSLTNTEEKSKKNVKIRNTQSLESCLETISSVSEKNKFSQVGLQAKKSRKSFEKNNENQFREKQEDTQMKRIKLDKGFSTETGYEELFQYECIECQVEISSLDRLLCHIDECHKKITQDQPISKKNAFESKSYKRNIQLDCRMGMGLTENSLTSLIGDGKGNKLSDEIALKKQALIEKLGHKEQKLHSFSLIKCRFCDYSSANLIEFNEHLALHGI